MMSNYTLKRELAEFAASWFNRAKPSLSKNGSSNALLARTLGEQKKNVTIITVSSYIAHLLKDAPCEVILLGGVYQKKKRKYGWSFDTPVHPTGAFQQSIYWYDGCNLKLVYRSRYDAYRCGQCRAGKRVRSDSPD
ncbi:DeoR-family transcriptional regulator [Escherichia coli]|uniref:DeoR-family transcriptional regulator n=1 Tax=Escherichia coli TaxID=562 RepID=A0A377D5L8_ECOLX|nr:DeoR-family transcriptional regulator [Escherichia coli]